MHTCPECGQACYCNGDIDDCPVDQDAELDCVHCPDEDFENGPEVCNGECEGCSGCDDDPDDTCYGPLDDCDCERCQSARSMFEPCGRSCRVCGCDDMHACIVGGVPCHWVEEDLCSACAGLRRKGDIRRRRHQENRARKARVRWLHRLGYRSLRRY